MAGSWQSVCHGHSGRLTSVLLSGCITVFSFVASGWLFLFKGIIRLSARWKERCASDCQLPLRYLGHELGGSISLPVPGEACAVGEPRGLGGVFLACTPARCLLSVSSMNLWLGRREGFCESALCSPSFIIFMTAVHVKNEIPRKFEHPLPKSDQTEC